MKAEYKKVLEMLSTANSEEIKMLAKVLYNIIDGLEFCVESKDNTISYLKQRIAELESVEEPLLKSKDERIAFLEDWLKDKDDEIERLRLQVRTNEFDRLFVFGTGKA